MRTDSETRNEEIEAKIKHPCMNWMISSADCTVRKGEGMYRRVLPSPPVPRSREVFSMNFKGISVLLIVGVLLFSCQGKKENQGELQIAVFVPGQLEGSPTYEMMDRGVRKAAEGKAAVLTIEGGFNQGEWESKLLTLAAEAKYDLIVTSNPSMPEICQRIGEDYPKQLFLVLDGVNLESDNLISVVYNHMEQAFLAGHLAGLITTSDMEGANSDLKVGLIAGQLYPDMELSIKPGMEIGLRTIHPMGEVDFRVLGNWYDAAKAAELARSMYDSGVDVILPIAGGANMGVISAAKEAGKYVLWFDSNGNDLEPGVVLGSSLVDQENVAFEMVSTFLEGDLEGGTVFSGGVAEGYIRFDEKDANYQKYLPQYIQTEQNRTVDQMRSGKFSLKLFE